MNHGLVTLLLPHRTGARKRDKETFKTGLFVEANLAFSIMVQ